MKSKTIRFTALILAVMMLVSVFTACGNSKKGSDEPVAEKRMFTDSVGREVEIPTKVERILPSGNMAAMFMWPLCSDKLVSLASEFSEEALVYYGEKYKDYPITGDLYKTGATLNLEEVAKLAPDIIIDFGEPKKTISEIS